jgi:mannan endo-1,4-beta-mannosidase
MASGRILLDFKKLYTEKRSDNVPFLYIYYMTYNKGVIMKLMLSILFFMLWSVPVTAAQRFEAEEAIVDENSVQKSADAKASGGFYVNMKEGTLSFKVTEPAAGFFTLWACYSQPGDTNGKIQNLSINGVSAGQISFPKVDSFVTIKASPKIKLLSGNNTIEITKSWGWVNIDYIELTPYSEVPFSSFGALVTANPSKNTLKMFGFIKEHFQKKVISGVMTSTVMQNDGHYTPDTVENQEEVAYVIKSSGKTPALLGLDFLHAVGLKADDEWGKGYTNATIALAENIYRKGGFPAYCWHWRDPSHTNESFYSPSASGQTPTSFSLVKAYTDAACTTFNTTSTEYKGIVRDLDIIAGHLKILADKDIPVLWRPLHESSGKWFWWGYGGPKACKGLYRLMFNRFTKEHGLNNLIWVWTTDEASDALDWYPGDDYVDIVGRDYYYYPREANHGSLAASFEKLKELFGGKKIIALSENGSIPFPDEMKADGAAWSYFMPWNTEYTIDSWAHDNTAADWKKVLNNDYVITLDKMPGWANYTVPTLETQKKRRAEEVSVRMKGRFLEIRFPAESSQTFELYTSNGVRITTLREKPPLAGAIRFDLSSVARGIYIVKVGMSNGSTSAGCVFVK